MRIIRRFRAWRRLRYGRLPKCPECHKPYTSDWIDHLWCGVELERRARRELQAAYDAQPGPKSLFAASVAVPGTTEDGR